MATFKTPDLDSKPRHMGGYGNALVVWGTAEPAAGAADDVIRLVRIPAGATVTGVEIVSDALDSGNTLAVKVGFEPVDATEGPAADDDFFAQAGSTALRTAGRTAFVFHPLKFERDVYLIATVTAAATTFAAGKVSAIVTGEATGIK
jgi:hypothetical protein